jgi:spoIIIJ-associated protein
MTYEYEGATEHEAVEAACQDLGLERDQFDVEILETQKSGFLFKKGKVKIRVHTRGNEKPVTRDRDQPAIAFESRASVDRAPVDASPEAKDDFEIAMLEYVRVLVEKMGFPCKAAVLFREERKLGIRIESEFSSILIGKKGKNLDAIQLLANVYAGRQGREDLRVILDTENYRIRREESLVRLAYDSAERVRRSRQSVLLEPMNPFERRIIHTTLNDIVDIETKSEGEGLYKRVCVSFKGFNRG